MADIKSALTLTIDPDAMDALKRASEVLERHSSAELAFGYLLANTPCTCADQSKHYRVHDEHCVISVAIDIHDGRRPWPPNDR